jgi:hypothetical protein
MRSQTLPPTRTVHDLLSLVNCVKLNGLLPCFAGFRKVKYRVVGVLAKVVQETIASILDSLRRADLEEAKRKIQALAPEVKSEKERGGLLAALGIYSSMSKGKEGTLQTWDTGRIERAAKSITSSQMADDFDVGYAETLLSYAKLTANSQPSAG